MRVVLIGHHVAPIRAPFVGGVESFTWYLGRWLAGRGHDVVLHAPAGSAVPGVEVRELDLEPRLSRASRCDVDMPPDAFMSAHHAYQRVMLDLAHDPDPGDVVHSNTLHYLPLAMAGTLRIPVLTTLHTPPTPWLESAMGAAAAHGTPALSAVSLATRAAWSGIAPDPVVVRNGVDTALWHAGPGGGGAAWSGRIVPEKAPHLAIDACRAVGVHLTLAGPIVDDAYFRAEVEPRLGPGASYAGHLDHRRLRALVGGSGVALMTPAWDEPFGLAAAEAMACGTPVAAFDRGGLGDMLGTDGGRLAAPGDVGDLARAIGRSLAMDRRAVRRHAVDALGIDAMGRGYERLYERVAAGRGTRDPLVAPAPVRRTRLGAQGRRALLTS